MTRYFTNCEGVIEVTPWMLGISLSIKSKLGARTISLSLEETSTFKSHIEKTPLKERVFDFKDGVLEVRKKDGIFLIVKGLIITVSQDTLLDIAKYISEAFSVKA